MEKVSVKQNIENTKKLRNMRKAAHIGQAINGVA